MSPVAVVVTGLCFFYYFRFSDFNYFFASSKYLCTFFLCQILL